MIVLNEQQTIEVGQALVALGQAATQLYEAHTATTQAMNEAIVALQALTKVLGDAQV